MASLKWLQSSELCRWAAQPGHRLPPALRMAVYAAVAIAVDVVTTSVADFFLVYDHFFIGFSSLWSALQNGVGLLVLDLMYQQLRDRCQLGVRCLIYTFWLSLLQLAFGGILDTFDARPWDYDDLEYTMAGSVKLEKLPALYFTSVLAEVLLVRPLLSLTWSEPIQVGAMLTTDQW